MDPKDTQPQDGELTQSPTDQPEQPQAENTQQQPVQTMEQPEQHPPAAQPQQDVGQPQPPLEDGQSSSLEQPTTETLQQPVAAQQPSAPQQNMGAFGDVTKSSQQQKMMKKVIAIVAAVVVVGVIVLLVQAIFLSGSKIGNLVADSQDGISFMRPEKWLKAESEDEFTYFTEEGVPIDNVDLGLLLGSEQFGVSYDSLTEDEQRTVKGSFESQFASLDTSLIDGSCDELDEITSNEVTQEGYDLAFSINATCAKLQGKQTGGTVKIILGWHDEELHIFGVVGDDATWASDGDKLDEIVASVKPAE